LGYRKQISTSYLALVEDVDGRPATAEDLGIILIDSTLGITNGRNIFDDNNVVGMFPLTNGSTFRNFRSLEKKAVGVNHVIDNTTFADLLAPELPLSRQVTTVVVSKMIIRSNGKWLDTGVDKKLGKNRLKLSLAGLEIVATDEGFMTLSELDGTRNKGVLGSTINERLVFEDGSNSEESGRGNLRVGVLDRIQEVIRGIIDTGDDVAVTLGISGPEDNNAIETVVQLKLANVSTNLIKMSSLVSARNKIVGTLLLIGRDKIGIIYGRKRLAEESHVRSNLALKVVIQDLSAHHSLIKTGTRDIPTTKDEVVGVNHGKNIRYWNMYFFAIGIGPNADSRCTQERTNVVGLLNALFGMPRDIVAIG